MTGDRVVDKRRTYTFYIDDAAIDSFAEQIGVYGIALYALLVRHSRHHETFLGYKFMMSKLQIGRSTLVRTLALLEEVGLIAIETRRAEVGDYDTKLYKILDLSHLRGGTTRVPPGTPETPPGTPETPRWYHTGTTMKESSFKGLKPKTPNPTSGEQILAATGGEQNHGSEGEHPGDTEGSVRSEMTLSPLEVHRDLVQTHPAPAAALPKNSRAAGTNPRQMAQRAQEAAKRQEQEHITACALCDAKGMLLFFDATGIGYTNTCPHDLPKILAYVESHGYTWPHAPPGATEGGPAP